MMQTETTPVSTRPLQGTPGLKDDVRAFWNEGSCGEVYAKGIEDARLHYATQAALRYALEPYLPTFAEFGRAAGKDVLEIGVGMGADHEQLARAKPKSLTGVDLTPRALEHTRKRFEVLGLTTTLQEADAEKLPFADASFDLVYSWGVIHHSPNTAAAVAEIWRVLRPGGVAKVMIYHTYSMVGYLLWVRYALLRGKPRMGLAEVYHRYLESPGTKAYSVAEGRALFSQFAKADVRAQLSFGDLLEGEVGQRHAGLALTVLKKIWPRTLIRWASKPFNFGLYLCVTVEK